MSTRDDHPSPELPTMGARDDLPCLDRHPTCVRIDDGIAFHPGFLRCPPEALALFVAGLCYCHRYQTGGLLPRDAVPHLLPTLSRRRALRLAEQLAAPGPHPCWLDEGGHFRVQDEFLHSAPHATGRHPQHPQKAERQATDRHPREAEPQATDRRAQDAERQRRCRARRAARAAGGLARDQDRAARRDRDRDLSRDTPLPGPLPPPPPLPSEREFYLPKSRSISHTHSLSQPRAPARDLSRDAERDVTRDMSRDLPRDTERDFTPDTEPDAPPHAAAAPGPPAPAPDFTRWFAAYPRQQGEAPARQAWAAARPLMPSLGELLAKLDLQKASPEWQNPRFVPLPARYLHEHRWRDQPVPPARPAARSPAAELRAMGSDEGRREALRRISEAARFDPFDDFPGEKRHA